jgi:hypothetical protein
MPSVLEETTKKLQSTEKKPKQKEREERRQQQKDGTMDRLNLLLLFEYVSISV